MVIKGRSGFPPTGHVKSAPAIIVPPKGSVIPCPSGWEHLQEDSDYVVYSSSSPAVVIGRAATYATAQVVAKNFESS